MTSSGRPLPISRWKSCVPLIAANGTGASGANAGDGQPDPVQARAGGHVERAPVVVSPGEVRRELRRFDRAEMLPGGRDDPYAARSRDVEVTLPVDLHAVERLLAGLARHVEEHLA